MIKDNLLWSRAIDNDGCRSYQLTFLGTLVVGIAVVAVISLALVLVSTSWTTTLSV